VAGGGGGVGGKHLVINLYQISRSMWYVGKGRKPAIFICPKKILEFILDVS